MPVYRNLWGPQQQLARRHLIEQTSNTLGTTDRDPTIRRTDGGMPYQQRRLRDPAYATVGAVQQHLRKRLTTIELGLADADATIRAPWADGSAYLRPAPVQPPAVTATHAWARNRLTTNDLGLADYDPTVQQPWIYMHPFSLFWRPSSVAAVSAYRQWQMDRLPSSVLGTPDADPTIRPLYAAANPYQLRQRDPTAQAIAAVEVWLRNRLNTTDLGDTDADATIRPPYQDPWQRRRPDPAGFSVEAWLQWFRKTSTSNEAGTDDADPTVRAPWQDPWQRRAPDPAFRAVVAHRAWELRITRIEDLDLLPHLPYSALYPTQLRGVDSSWPAINAVLAHRRLWGSSPPVATSGLYPDTIMLIIV